jgi:hypothetical protein
MFKKLLLPLVVIAAAAASIGLATPAHAAILDNFDPGNIITDKNFTDADSMSADDIQAFFVKMNSTCLVNFRSQSLVDANNDGLGDEPYGKGRDERVLASTLIAQAAKLYGINPKVILVTLQKEQGLITRSDCPSWRYNTALGYGCPDSAPCDTAAYGFTRQIDYGTWHFKGFFTDTYPVPTKTVGPQTILYNPSTSCGSSVVTVKNRATAALYSYTPYQPNQAALNAGYGEAPCGAYGNRNFFLYYSSWFGIPNSGTDTLPLKCDDGYYLLENTEDRKRMITPSAMAAWGFDEDDFYVSEYGCGFSTFQQPLGTIVKSRSSGKVYYVDNRTAYHITSDDEVSAWGLPSTNSSNIPQVQPDVILSNLTTASKVPRLVTSTNPTRTDVYLISNKVRHLVTGTSTAATSTSLRLIQGYNEIPVKEMSVAALQALAVGDPIDYSFRVGATLYLLDHNNLRRVNEQSTGQWSSITGESASLNNDILSLFNNKSSLSDQFERNGYHYRVGNNGLLTRTLDSSVATNWGNPTPTITNLLTSKVLEASTSVESVSELTGNLRLIACGNERYVVERNIQSKRVISAEDITAWQFDNKHFFTNDKGCAYKTYDRELGTVVRSRNTKKLYYIDQGKAYYLSNEQVASQHGLSGIQFNDNSAYAQLNPKSLTDNVTIVR